MFEKRKFILGFLVLLFGFVFTGCSGDSAVTELTNDVDGPKQMIVGEESYEFRASGSTGADYLWQVDDGLGSFTETNSATTRFIPSDKALQAGTIDLQVLINNKIEEIKNIEVLGTESKTEYAQGTFHSIVATKDLKRKGYVAVGTVGNLDLEDYKEPYMLKAGNDGIIIDEKQFNRDGRFYNVQDFVRTGLGDYYYLIGYGRGNGDVYEAFILEVNNKMEVKKEYNSKKITTGNAYLRSGIIAKTIFTNDHVIAVGNKELDNGNYAPYIIDINTNNINNFEHHTLNLTNPYYNLESIVETSNGYIAVGFTNDSESTRKGANGFIVKLDSDFNVLGVNENITEKLYRIKKVENVNEVDYVLVGELGYVAEVKNDNNNLGITETNIGSATYRDVIVDNGNYIIVGHDTSKDQGVVLKLTAGNLTEASSFEKNYGSYLYSIDKATDGDYLLAGHNNNSSYVVKIDPTAAEPVNRIKE